MFSPNVESPEPRRFVPHLNLKQRRQLSRQLRCYHIPTALFGPGPLAAVHLLAELEDRDRRKVDVYSRYALVRLDPDMSSAYLVDGERPWTPVPEVVNAMCDAGGLRWSSARCLLTGMTRWELVRAGWYLGRRGYVQLGLRGYEILDALEEPQS